MASPEILHTQNDSGSFPSDDFSLLPEVETGNIPNGDTINHYNDCFNFTNMQSALNNTASDSIVEVHSQLGELIEENLRLKEQLHKNNSMMEDQISTIQSWRDHMLLSKNQLEENLKTALQKISSMEKENADLHKKVDALTELNQKENVKSHMQTIDLSSIENLHENLKITCQNLEAVSLSSTCEEEKTLLHCCISLLKSKMASLKGDIGHMDSSPTDEETDYEIVRLKTHESGVLSFHKAMKELTEKVQDKEREITCLMNEKQEMMEKIKEYEVKLQQMEVSLKSQYELLNNKLQNESSLSQRYRDRCESLQQQVEEYQEKLEQSKSRISNADVITLREEIQQLQAILGLEQQAKEVEKERYLKLLEKCENLQVDYDRVKKLLEIQTKEDKSKNEKLSLSVSDVKKYMEEVDYLTAKLLEMEEKLEESNAEVKRLREQSLQIDGDPESISILKAQIDLYKTDYHKLESAKNAASDEVERLKNELKKYEKDDSSRSQNRRASVEIENGATGLIKCPVCQMGFSSESAAENHVNRCIEGNQGFVFT